MKSLVIIGRKWFDKVNGNTYYTSEIIIDGEIKHKTEMQYGYDDAYIQTAKQWLIDNGYIVDAGNICGLWTYCKENNIDFVSRSFYGLKRDL
jgi:hypothetical protein